MRILLKFYFVLFILLNNITPLFAQTPKETYNMLIHRSVDKYLERMYFVSGSLYAKAFKINIKIVNLDDRYNAACAWALANQKDSSFNQLFNLAKNYHYLDKERISVDNDFVSLHNDVRWNQLVELILKSSRKANLMMDENLKRRLDTIYEDDQKFRAQFESIYQTYGTESIQMERLRNSIRNSDSINQIKIKMIINKYGWPSAAKIGAKGSSALFLVIQHSNLKMQEHFLPILKRAVNEENASRHDLALLQDRIALAEGKQQIYGTQLGRDDKTQKFYVLSLVDPDNVDKRRALIGLPSIKYDLVKWGINWDVKAYKTTLLKNGQLQSKRR